MKIEQVLVLHLYNNKQITLQGIGTFRLDPSVSLPPDTEREISIPASAITFYYDPKATEDDSLVEAIVKNTTKIKPLASADLDSFLMLGRQFMNIGKQFVLEGIGTLEKTQPGKLDFKAGQYVTQKIEAPKALKENENEESSGLFNDYNKEPESNTRKIALIIASIVALGLICWAIYHFAFRSDNQTDTASVNINNQNTTLPDTLLEKKDSVATINTTNPVVIDSSALLPEKGNEEGFTFRIVFDEFNNKEAALNSMNKLNSWGRNVIMYTSDSVRYKLAELFRTPLSDTSRAKEYFTKFYKDKVYVEVKR